MRIQTHGVTSPVLHHRPLLLLAHESCVRPSFRDDSSTASSFLLPSQSLCVRLACLSSSKLPASARLPYLQPLSVLHEYLKNKIQHMQKSVLGSIFYIGCKISKWTTVLKKYGNGFELLYASNFEFLVVRQLVP